LGRQTFACPWARISGAARPKEGAVEHAHHDVGAMIPLTREQYRRAALTVCSRARDLEDAALLLDALGLSAALRAEAVPV
jgi:lysophospholipid acyltransferase (LPLAT)-like uncharacterized protein